MPKIANKAAFIALLIGVSSPALAQPIDQSELRRQYEETTQRQKPVPVIPAALRPVVSAPSNEWLVIRMSDDSQHRFGIGSVDIEDMESFANGRFIGFEVGGHEEYGYILIDRTGRGELAEIPTGGKPVFSGDGRHFAGAEYSESGFGNLNGIALWEVMPAGVKRLFYTDVVRDAHSWRAESFRGTECVHISAVPQSWEPSTPERWEAEIATATREHFALRFDADSGLGLYRADDAACFDDSSG